MRSFGAKFTIQFINEVDAMTFPSMSSLFESQANSFLSGDHSPNLKTIQILKNSLKSAKMSKKQTEDNPDARDETPAVENRQR